MFHSITSRRVLVAAGMIAGVVGGSLALGVAAGTGTVAAHASTCGDIYGGDMPTDTGAAASSCQTSSAPAPAAPTTSAPAPTTSAPTPPPVVKTTAPVVSKPVTAKPVTHAPVTHPTTTHRVITSAPRVNTPVVRHQPAVNRPPATRKAVPHVKKTTAAPTPVQHPLVHTAQQPASTVCTTPNDYSFPWLLVLAFAAGTMLAGGLIGPRMFIAHGHKWSPLTRRVAAGPDHHLLPAPVSETEQEDTPVQA